MIYAMQTRLQMRLEIVHFKEVAGLSNMKVVFFDMNYTHTFVCHCQIFAESGRVSSVVYIGMFLICCSSFIGLLMIILVGITFVSNCCVP